MTASSAPRFHIPGWMLLLGILTAIGSVSIDMYLPAFPAIQQSLNASSGSVQLTLTTFFVGMLAGQLVYGPASDRFGRKKPLMAGLALYSLASIGCMLAQSIESLMFWRFIQAFGACSGIVLARAIVRDRCDPREAARSFSMLMLIMGVSPILAPLLGGYILQVSSWRTIFGINVAFGIGCLIAVTTSLRDTRQPDLATSLNPFKVFSAYVEILRDREFSTHAISGGFAQAGLYAYLAGSPFVLIELFHLSPTAYGWVFCANSVGLIAASQFNAALLKGNSIYTLLRHGLTAALAASALLIVAGVAGIATMPLLLAGIFCFMSSLGFVNPNAAAASLANHPERAGSASSLLGTLQYGLATIATFAMGMIHDGTARPLAFAMALCGILGWAINRYFVRAKPA
ncbi:Bcr/CflA family drug resistance efflux transporter [Jeongeupia sp. HS-3]|uniref:multidrug effflux MFS transporter n=1 Tax=Jeongeupia sp. HS-3 TaxID=1009682 RepID=UPI0018A3A577|nr:multidrug effflux MFS transporter [Jeongeupia sp. HS-3]BCL74839.1 Bcr/CflA family drug resistance efflux transporter [Jeongeupia sp. HS-3]